MHQIQGSHLKVQPNLFWEQLRPIRLIVRGKLPRPNKIDTAVRKGNLSHKRELKVGELFCTFCRSAAGRWAAAVVVSRLHHRWLHRPSQLRRLLQLLLLLLLLQLLLLLLLPQFMFYHQLLLLVLLFQLLLHLHLLLPPQLVLFLLLLLLLPLQHLLLLLPPSTVPLGSLVTVTVR